jgi:hypothetical protein
MTAELLDTPYPTTPPRDLPPDIQRLWRCNFCATGLHGSCPGAVRNARRGKLVRCYCCTREPYCVDCKATEGINPADWACVDGLACAERVRARLEGNPLHRQLQECRTESLERQRRIRTQAEAIRAGLDPDEIDEFERPQEKKPRVPRPAVGACECCGEATKGGKFLPGHDAKMKSRLREAAKQGDMDAQTELERRGW